MSYDHFLQFHFSYAKTAENLVKSRFSAVLI
uniref:UPF0225 domain protein n=1 Tax=Siphoviridae sp. ctiuu37 TaxID=2825628 RepID=A0A8S5V7N7_9CAUD|nr:MAG TPA: UPF0225 domain protein [Siphoviridae sp. ctiuu37]